MHHALVSLCLVASLAVLVSGCDKDERLRSEARAFLASYEAIDFRAPAAEREAKLSALEKLTFLTEDVQKARTDCVSAHRALLAAEKGHEHAAKRLDEALVNAEAAEPLDPSTTQSIRAEIESADRELAQARERFTTCENEARSLSLRFGTRS